MAEYSRAGPGSGIETPEDVIIEHIEEFDTTRLFIGWRGNGYLEETCWLIADHANVCQLSAWE